MDAKALLDGLEVGVIAIAPDWTIAEWTAGAARLTGVPAAQAVGKVFWAAFPSAKGTQVEQLLQDVMHDGLTRAYLVPGRAETFGGRSVEVTASRVNRSHLALVLREADTGIAPESKAGQLLSAFEQERRFYRQIFDALAAPALVLGVDSQILEANPAAAHLLGTTSPSELRGWLLSDWTHAPQRPVLAAALRDAVQQRQQVRLPIEFGGEPVQEVEAVIQNLDAGNNPGPPKLFFFASDISREILLQRKLLRSDRLSQLGALVSGVAHELNNPLAAIAAFAELLAGDAKDPQAKEGVEIIHAEAIRAGRVVQTLLDFARQRPHVTVAVDLKDVIDRVLALQRNALKRARVQAVVTIPDHVPAVMGDPQELQQVVLNGVVNAIQAIEATGRAGKIMITARRNDAFVSITIEDTGPGVPADALERVFDPFFTTKGEAGTGLGLSISMGLVRGMGGRLWMQNVEGGGARLVLELPSEQEAPLVAAPAKPTDARKPLAVLVVEDEDSVRRAMVRLLERLGHKTTSVGGYDAAREQLRAAPRFDAVIVDVHLDESHTGFELFDALLQEGKGLERRIVFTTGDSISQRTRDALLRAERPVLKKPFRLEDLREILERVGG